MNEKFFKLDSEKQERILNAALNEFASFGYDKASTNNIVKNAGISKGLLFHYFNSKKELYYFLYNYSVDYAIEKFNGEMDYQEKDLLLFLEKTLFIKIQLMRKYPNLFNFFISCYMDTAKEAKELNIMNDARALELKNNAYKHMDYTLFREDMDFARMMATIEGTLEQFSTNEMRKLQITGGELDLDYMYNEITAYTAMFRRLFYKPEHGGGK
ncbi:TetR/AcrR family transcriptional regulator [Vallitalea pronyensis]|uniref:TetR/AcrR family transcriptional regulator n=1 Tax=Vallitalea pronyensis TaxID=1348613 RepID=A0A8J8MLS0_9FIRM|nr:TetR/AcrR family transcriptional regulator [Vallitalea pronyensis]QUI24015.1 TetR/AcrR family transcriptional regulator [Vallitalea pronyensis]